MSDRTPAPPQHPWPATRQVPVVETVHGVSIRDPYRWLEDEHAPDVQAWMKAQDDYARGELAKLPERAALADRLRQLFYFDAVTAPDHEGGRYFYSRKHADKEKSVVYWKQGDAGTETVLFDPNTWSEDGSKGLHGWWASYDGKHVAYNVSEHNSDETVMHVIDVATGKDLPDVIPGSKYATASWTPDGRGFYYTWLPPVGGEVTTAARPGFAEMRFHALGTDPSTDPVVHEATHDASTFLGGSISRDGHWLFAMIQHGWNATDVYFKDPHSKGGWQTLVAGVPAMFYVDVWRDHFYVMTNDGAPRFRVYDVDAKHPAREAWKEIVPQQDATLESASVVGEHLVLRYLQNAANVMSIHDLHGKLVRKVEVPALGTITSVTGNPDEDTAYVSYTSFTVPQVIYKTSIKKGKVDEWARVTLPLDTSRMVTEQVFFPSKDGTKISMFIIHRADAPRDGSAPTVLYGYGGFNVSLTPGFSGLRAVWLEHGGI